MLIRLDEKDLAILKLVQENSKLTARQIAQKINSPITTVFAKIKRMEEQDIICEYRAILAPEKLASDTAAFIFASVSYRTKNDETTSQRIVAKEVALFPEVQEVHIITGDWDLLIKLRTESVEAVGKFVVDKLRLIDGLEKTLTCMVFETIKETTKLVVPKKSIKKNINL
ncbi:MAG: Lrp/AsnC family transcriptional regulator [Candidatus Bathyarchaeota archaeon]|nr:Lrp/AsnC family transcriptional regulator [Candidatus Bathyarchaeota archaeon]